MFDDSLHANGLVNNKARAIIHTLVKDVPSLRVHSASAAVNKSCLGAKEEMLGRTMPGMQFQYFAFKKG